LLLVSLLLLLLPLPLLLLLMWFAVAQQVLLKLIPERHCKYIPSISS
jgi:hypothetical protein